VKNPFYMLFPVSGTLEIKEFKDNGYQPVQFVHMTVKSYDELNQLLH